MRIDSSQNVNIGATALGARVGIKGSGSTSATTSLLVQNSVGTEYFAVQDNGTVRIANNQAFRNGTSGGSNYFDMGNIIVRNGDTTQGGSISIGTGSAAVASAMLELSSTTKGFLCPRMTTTQKNAIATPAAGLVVYDSTTNKLCCYNGSTWNDLF
jgi:hypothetical protein